MNRFYSAILAILISNFYSLTFAQFTHSFEYAGNIENNNAWNVAVGPDSTVILSTPTEQLLFYDHVDTSFINLRLVNTVGDPAGLVVRDDGIVFSANGNDLDAYVYDDTSVTNIAHIDYNTLFTTDVAVGPDGNIFVSTQGGGVLAYSFDDSVFTLLDQETNPVTADGIAVGPDTTVYLAARNDGLYAFSFSDSNFVQTAHFNINQANNVATNQEGTVFFANGNSGGLRVFEYTGSSFDSLTQWEDPRGALNVEIADDGTVFLANSLDGLRAFTFEDSILINTAHIDPGGNTRDVAVSPSGVIFIAADGAGWHAYTYETLATNINENKSQVPNNSFLSKNYPNPFNPSTNIEFILKKSGNVKIEIFNINGEKIKTFLNENKTAGKHSVFFDAKDLSSGLYFYQIETSERIESGKMILTK